MTDLAKARKQQQDRRSECRKIVTLNPIEQLKADAVELIGPWRFEGLRIDSCKVTYEFRRERPHLPATAGSWTSGRRWSSSRRRR